MTRKRVDHPAQRLVEGIRFPVLYRKFTGNVVLRRRGEQNVRRVVDGLERPGHPDGYCVGRNAERNYFNVDGTAQIFGKEVHNLGIAIDIATDDGRHLSVHGPAVRNAVEQNVDQFLFRLLVKKYTEILRNFAVSQVHQVFPVVLTAKRDRVFLRPLDHARLAKVMTSFLGLDILVAEHFFLLFRHHSLHIHWSPPSAKYSL